MESEQQSGNTMYVASADKNTTANAKKKKRMFLGIIALAIALLIAIVLYVLLAKDDDIDATKPTHTVAVSSTGFTPSTIKVKKGEEIAWVNNDIDAHEITADQDDAPGLDSATPLAEGDSYIFTFEKTGTINYYDPLNPTAFKGTVIVE